MKSYDVVVVGSGAGMMVADAAVNSGLKVALVEMGKLGGTCLNVGCIPSKMVLYPADLVQLIASAPALGVKARVEEVDFQAIMRRTRGFTSHDREAIEEAIWEVPGLDFYPERAEFVSDYTLRVGEETIKGENIFLATGARPLIPPIEGLGEVEYLTNDNVWELEERPDSLVIVGGGFVACEMAHFFQGMGAEVTLLSRSPRLLKHAEPEISAMVEESLSQRMVVETGVEVVEAHRGGEGVVVGTRQGEEYQAQSLLLATGRKSNADLLHPERTGVQVDERGYIVVDEAYRTTKPGIWAFGDAIGKAMYRHVANKEAELCWHAYATGHIHPLDYDQVPYAVYTWPQVASVGLTEGEAKRRGLNYLVGEYWYSDTAKGAALGQEGYVKVLVGREGARVLGAHICGVFAPILIQEVINAMNTGDHSLHHVREALHIHPALPEVVQRAFYNLREPGEREK